MTTIDLPPTVLLQLEAYRLEHKEPEDVWLAHCLVGDLRLTVAYCNPEQAALIGPVALWCVAHLDGLSWGSSSRCRWWTGKNWKPNEETENVQQ